MRNLLIGSSVAFAIASAAGPSSAQTMEDATLAYPNIALTFSAAYVAEDFGLFAKHGVRLKSLMIAGPGATNAVISGSAQFSLTSVTVQTRAAARGQRLLSIANPTDRPLVQIILRKDLVPNFDPKAPMADRVRLLRGRTIAVDAIGSIIHAYPLMLAHRAGFQPSEIRISPMAPPSALAALKTRQIDGFAMSMPWPIGPVLEGDAVVIANGIEGDPPDMVPFGMATLVTKPETCEKRKSLCMGMGHAMAEATAFLRAHPDEVRAKLKHRFSSLDDKVFAAGFEQIRKATQVPPVMVRAALENGERYSIEAGLLKPGDKLKSYDGLFSEEYVK
jgi:ABC-type nitrate/sulfonate/bicarbonate transport system substrate-binding protein